MTRFSFDAIVSQIMFSLNPIPSFTDAISNTLQIMQRSILNQKISRQAPTIYIEPEIVRVWMFDFHKADQIKQQARPAKERFKRELKEKLK